MAEAAAAEQAREEAAAGAEEAVKIICLGDSAVGKSKCVAAPVPAARPGLAGGEGAAASPCAVLFPQAAGEVPARRIVSTRRAARDPPFPVVPPGPPLSRPGGGEGRGGAGRRAAGPARGAAAALCRRSLRGEGTCTSVGSLTRSQPPPAALHLRPDAVQAPRSRGREAGPSG